MYKLQVITHVASDPAKFQVSIVGFDTMNRANRAFERLQEPVQGYVNIITKLF